MKVLFDSLNTPFSDNQHFEKIAPLFKGVNIKELIKKKGAYNPVPKPIERLFKGMSGQERV